MSWLETRRQMEARIIQNYRRQSPEGEHSHPSYDLVCRFMSMAFRLLGLYGRGNRNAKDLRLHQLVIPHPAVPTEFDGFTLLFISDIHVGSVSEVITEAVKRISDLTFDMAVLGGDYQLFGNPSAVESAEMLEPLLATLRDKAPLYAILGNHDRHDLPPELERRGARVLINQHIVIERNGKHLVLIGLDDIHAFYTDAALKALRDAPDGFKLAAIHSPEFANQAAAAGVNLYLAGHTHGGQVCLPGGKPIVTAMNSHRALAVGQWRHNGMVGYTSTGLGSAIPPVRFNCRPELAFITLRRSA